MSARFATNDAARDVPALGPSFGSLTPSGVGAEGRRVHEAIILQLDEYRGRRAESGTISPIEHDLTKSNQQLWTILAACVPDLDPDSTDRIRARLAALLNPQEWDEGDELPNLESFRRMIMFLAGNPRLRTPAIFLNRFGLFSLSWRPEKRKLASLVFQPRNDVTWLIFLPRADDPDDTREIAGRSPVEEVVTNFQMHGALDWMMRA